MVGMNDADLQGIVGTRVALVDILEVVVLDGYLRHDIVCPTCEK